MTCKDCIHYEACEWFGCIYTETMADECLRYEDKSRYIELPCKVGDTFYCICRYYSKGVYGDYFVDERQISSFEIDKHGLTIWDYDGLDFTENVYFTREEAEKALKEKE